MNCQICTEPFNKSTRAPITCICENTCCRTCAKSYIESKNVEAHCMFCKNRWNMDFLSTKLDRKYINNEYKANRTQFLFERELQLLPITQPHVENQIKAEAMQVEIKALERKREQLENTIILKYRELNNFKNNKTADERRKYVRKCPSNECKGFLSSQLKCDLCNVWVCSECREPKGVDKDAAAAHVCNPEILESVKLLNADSKNCPSCSTIIFKIEGCNQMFCTECKTAFDWRTLRIEKGAIHNPHYFEWQRQQRAATAGGDAPAQAGAERPAVAGCRAELTHEIVAIITRKIANEYNEIETISNINFKQLLISNLQNEQYQNLNDYIARHLQYVSIELPKFEFARDCLNRIKGIGKMPSEKTYVANHVYIHNLRITLYLKRIEDISNLVRNTIHIRHVIMEDFAIDRINDNLDLRILYMRNKMREEEFKILVEKRNKKVERNVEYSNVLGMYVTCMTDLIYRINDNIDDYLTVLTEMHELRKYTNTHMKKILKSYGSSMTHSINSKFEYTKTKTEPEAEAKESKDEKTPVCQPKPDHL